MSTLADNSITALRSNHNDLAAMVSRFDEPDLARQSGASEWDVGAVLSHLGSGAEIMLAGLRAAVAGDAAPRALTPRHAETYASRWDSCRSLPTWRC